MEISISSNSGSNLSLNELLPYLSEVVLSVSNEDIKMRKETLEEKKSSLTQKKKDLGIVKTEIIHLGANRKKLNVLKRCLILIDTLNREGIIRGSNQKEISKLLLTIKSKTVQSLSKLEERLTLYLPDRPNQVSIL